MPLETIHQTIRLKFVGACPKCKESDLYLRYADHERAEYTCLKCHKSFDSSKAIPASPTMKNVYYETISLLKSSGLYAKEQ